MANWCFDVANEKDASLWSVSGAAQGRCVTPELWGSKQAGVAYIDGPPVPAERLALSARMFLWTQEQMVERAKAWPASEKDADEFTARVEADTSTTRPAPGHDGEDEPEDGEETEGSAVEQDQTTEDTNPAITAGNEPTEEAPRRAEPNDGTVGA